MALLASEVMDRTRAVLNDVVGDLYTNVVLLPYLKIANDDLSDELTDNGSTVNKEIASDAPLSAGNTLPILPNDMIVPIELYEKNQGEDNSAYRKMHQRSFLPNALPGQELTYWSWREQTINTLGSTQNKVIRVRYYRLITQVIGENSNIELTHALNYLAYHTAALVAEHVGQNRAKAIDLESIAAVKLAKLLKKEVKQTHSVPTRRRPFRLPRFNVFTR